MALRSTKTPPPAAAADAKPGHAILLVESHWRLSDMARGDCGFTATAEGFGAGKAVWSGVAPGKYVMSAKRAGKTLWSQDLVVDDSRRVAVTVAADANNPLVLELACVPAS